MTGAAPDHLLRDLVGSSRDGILAFDRQYRYTLWNPAMETISGLQASEVLGREAFAVFPFLRAIGEDAHFHRALQGESSITVERPYTVPISGRTGFFEAHYAPLRDSAGSVAGGFAIVRDVTERLAREAESARLLQQEEHSRGQVRLAAMLERIGDACAMLDAEYRLTYLNSRAAHLCRKAPEELVGKVIWDVLPDLRQSASYAMIARALSVPTHVQWEHYDAPHDLWFENDAYPTEDGLAVFTRDVTARKRSEAALADIQERFSRFMHHLPGAAWMKDLNGRYVYANPEAERIFNVPFEILQGKTDRDVFPEETAREFRSNDAQVLATGDVVEDIEHLPQADGVHQSIIRKFPVPGHQGLTAYVGGVAFDITDRLRAEAALSENLAHLATIIETAPDSVVTIDEHSTIQEWNPQAEEMFGWSKPEVLGAALDIILPERYRTAHHRGVARFLETGDGPVLRRRVELTGLRRSGEEFPLELAISPTRTGERWLFTAFVRDITARVRIEAQLREQAAALARSNAELEQYAFAASHDLQEPLRVIVTHTQLLERRNGGQLSPEAVELLGTVRQAAQRMQQLVSDLLDYSRVASFDERPAMSADLNAVLQHALKLCAASVEESGMALTSDSLPAVPGDPEQLTQVFQNLLTNAIKYRDPSVPLRVHIGVQLQSSEMRVTVQDNGIGISPQYHERIFGLFTRLHGRDIPGTGIGLALCRRIVERHGGTIGVTSALGEGSTFWMILPMRTEGTR